MTAPTGLAFTVIGTPAPQGSKRHVGNGRMVESSKAVQPWRDSVAWAARARANATGTPTLTGPVHVDIRFRLPMPKSRKAADHRRGWAWSERKPDLDKLTRSTLDALTTSGVIGDDAQVAMLTVDKCEIGPDSGVPLGASIQIRPATPYEDD
jgi:crossover junction endodeoxyribonuclease RusA